MALAAHHRRAACRAHAITLALPAALAVVFAAPAAVADEAREPEATLPPDAPAATDVPAATDAPSAPAAPVAEPVSTGLGPTLLERPHTIAIIEAGILALPTAPISPSQQGGSTPFGAFGKGDATVELGLHVLYRATPQWAAGAGIMFGPQPTSEKVPVVGTDLDRRHSRSYFTVGGEVRYSFVRFRWVEAWVGLTGGVCVIADRYATLNGIQQPTILGTPESYVRTEGVFIGAQLGVDWMFADRWVAGFAARSERWLLPSVAASTALGDQATLTGIVEVLQFALNVGYRLPF